MYRPRGSYARETEREFRRDADERAQRFNASAERVALIFASLFDLASWLAGWLTGLPAGRSVGRSSVRSFSHVASIF